MVVKAFKPILNSGGALDCPDSLFPPEESGVRGFYLGNNGLLTPTLFLPAGEEREKNGGSARTLPRQSNRRFVCGVS